MRILMAVCPHCQVAVVLDNWHECCCGVFRVLSRNPQTGNLEAVAVPRAVATAARRQLRTVAGER